MLVKEILICIRMPDSYGQAFFLSKGGDVLEAMPILRKEVKHEKRRIHFEPAGAGGIAGDGMGRVAAAQAPTPWQS